MTVLTVCEFGMNRSRYLAEYLSSLGYNTIYGGVREEYGILQEKIDQADIVVSVHPQVSKKLMSYNLGSKQVIHLEVTDKTGQLDGDDWTEYQFSSVYPRLKKQIDKHLPLKA